jgi:Fe-S cluster assembly iron-binding protein IscA
MDKKIKIKVSDDAYYRLIDILKDGDIYSNIRMRYKDGCCGSSKIELFLDNAQADDFIDTIEDLPFLYDLETAENINEVTIVYRKGSFMVNSKLANEKVKNCADCKSGCGGKGSSQGGCSNCKKDGCH